MVGCLVDLPYSDLTFPVEEVDTFFFTRGDDENVLVCLRKAFAMEDFLGRVDSLVRVSVVPLENWLCGWL